MDLAGRRSWRFVVSVSAAVVDASAALAAPVQTAAATGCSDYYGSASSGGDSNSRCSSTTARQSLAKVNATTFGPGNQVLFTDGVAWAGALASLGSGASGSPIVITSYRSGPAPVIARGVWDSAAGTIRLYVNGGLQGTTRCNSPCDGVLGTTTIGAAEWNLSPVDFVNGTIDDVHLYNRTLTSAQTSTLAAP